MTTNLLTMTEWREYLTLVKERPQDFIQNSHLSVVLDESIIADYMRETGITIGVMYRSRFSILVVDLVEDSSGNHYPYERILPASTGDSVVAVPIHDGRYVLLKQFRHAMRDYQYAFPRGFGEDGLSAEQNACKELDEELGAQVLKTSKIGSVVANSGISGDETTIVLCEVDGYKTNRDYEGIVDVVELTPEEIESWIASGRISDGFTLSAWAILRAQA